ncbi:hypothetical protein BOX15_Mlig018619g2 [Macrostomum lignano]|uniref:Uncharacterized protein n=1 Tax=Macrostomum lignano TaxID=282301 RepID=A0A267GN82_9PLAT|nr:hypothetical protein BOX15_Mlig018619g2 [Macrostomum lignano]
MTSNARSNIAVKTVDRGFGALFRYETSKVVQISSIKVSVIYRLIQLLIIAYVIGWVVVYKKGYQDFDDVVSGVTTKVKGVQYTNLTGTSIGARIWDVADYVVPPQENNAFFITTNAVVTRDQTQGACDEDPSVAPCFSDADCPAGKPQMLGNGVNTGRCVPSSQAPNKTSCEILAWCPVEVDQLPAGGTMFPEAVNFTVLIKDSIEFPLFGVKRRNVLDYYNSSQLQNCVYNPDTDMYCPVFRIGDILKLAGIDNFTKIATVGGVVSITVNWDCNLDWDASYCNPTYRFRRLDDENTKIAKGWNFRYANYYRINDTDHRTLIKAYGLRFVVYVTGRAGRFNVIPLTMNLGSGLALLGIATVLCDMIVLYLHHKKVIYRGAKYETLEDDDAYRLMNEEDDGLLSETSQDARQRVRASAQVLDPPGGNYGAIE